MTAATPAHSAEVKRQLLAGLAQAISQLGTRLRRQEETASRMAMLVGLADAVASQAAQLSQMRNVSAAETAALAEALRQFLDEVTAVASQAAAAAVDGQKLVATLSVHATELDAVARSSAALDLPEIRARLRPLVATLAQAPALFGAPSALKSEVEALAAEATRLAERTRALPESSRAAGIAAVAIHKELRNFAEHAASLSEWIGSDAEASLAATEAMAARAQRAGQGNPSQPPPALGPATAVERLNTVVREGVAAAGRVWS